MIFLDELKPMVLYKKPFHLPIDEKDKRKGAVSFLLTPSYESSIQLMKNPLLVNNKYYESYYIEKDITYFINQEGYLQDISNEPYRNVINENKVFISKKIDSMEHPLYPYLKSNNEQEEILENVDTGLFFLSQDNMDNKTLSPRVPDNFLTKNGYEDNKTKRVCFSTSINKCLTALSMNCKDKEFYVHCPVGHFETYTPSLKEVPDRNITGEVWIKKSVKIVCIGKILVTGDDGKPGKKYTYGDNLQAELYGWDYKWVEKYSLNEASKEVISDPKRLAKSLKMKMNKPKYELNRMNDQERNNVGVEKNSNNKQSIEESSYSVYNSTFYQKKVKMVTATEDIKEGEVIDVIGSDLDGMVGPDRDGWNVALIDGKYIATENIRKGSNLFCHGTITESADININDEYIVESDYYDCESYEKSIILALNESDDRSELDKNFKSKGHLNLNSFKKTKIDDELAKKYDIYCTSDRLVSFEGYVYTDRKDDSFVCLVAVGTYKNKESWIQPIEIDKKYRGYNLSKQLLDVATKELGAKYLAVWNDNEVAIDIYKKYGFKVYKKVKYDKRNTAYYMTIDPKRKINPKYLNETYIGPDHREYTIENGYIRCKVDGQNIILAFNENLDENILNESSFTNTALHKLLYKERFKNNKEVFQVYDKVKEDVPFIKRTYLNYERYKQFNLFLDLSYYNQTFFKNNIYKLDKGVELYFEFINRFINDRRLDNAGYKKKTVFVPVKDWTKPEVSVYKFNQDINPISTIIRLLRTNATKLLEWKGIDFVFLSEKGYFKVDLSDIESTEITKVINFIERLRKDEPIEDEIQTKESRKAIVANIISKVEDSQKVKIDNLTGDSSNASKDELIKKIEDAASTSADTEEAIEQLEKDEYIKNIIASLAAEEDDAVKINSARAARINKLNDEFLNKKLRGVTVRDMLDNTEHTKELPVTTIKVDTVNEEWEEMQYINFEESYNLDEDIVAALYSLSKKTVPVMVRDIDIQDTSTSEDYIYTYTVNMEDVTGNRFTIKFDIPKFIDNKLLRLRGNDKTFNGQLTQIPVSKTDDDTVQVVSNYKKIFISRFGTTTGKSFVVTDRIIKTLRKLQTKEVKVTLGDNTRICNKYELPIDYVDIASEYSKIECKNFVFIFDQDEMYNKFKDKIDSSKGGIPVGYDTKEDIILYYDINDNYTFSSMLYSTLYNNSNEFKEIYDSTNVSTRYTYSKASILNNDIPVVVIMGYNEGLTTTLSKANIKYELVEKRPNKLDKNLYDVIKFNDGFLVYTLDYNSSLLLNGLKQCNTEDYSLAEVNSRSMWLDFLDLFGGRLLADGLDNFYDLMIDPITEEVLEYYKLPTDYVEILAYANYLLSDNKYYKHTDMSARRYRSNEIIAGYTYQAIADSYGEYRTNMKKNKKASMTMKQTTVIDRFLTDPTASDFSTLNPILELEAINSVTYKGLVGMNADRAYSLDKRTFDESMVNVLGLSTGFAGNVGITRQATMDMNITGKRGYIKVTEDTDKMNITKTFTATEALTPFGSRRDDPFRSAMTFIQTAKHGMRVKRAMPSLISNGADQALPYMITNKFAFKAKNDGKIIEKTEDYLIVEYKDKTHDFVDLRENVQKNSDGGFYVTLKLDSDLKVGSKITKGQILAYDKLSFSDEVGHTDDIAYNIGTLAKIAILNTDEGFEDSAIISDWLSDAMSSEVVVKKEITLPKNTNIYNMVKKGQPIQEGEPLMIFQNAFEEEDVNILLKNLVDDEEMISELGRIPIKSKITGVVEDIKISRTVEKDELSDSLKKKVNELEKPISDMKKVMKKYDIDFHDKFEADYKLAQTGKLKNVEDGVLIEFFLKYEDKMSVGDKVIYYSALKGVVKDIFPKNKEPYTDFRPDEKIHSLLSLGSVNGRMVTSVMINGALSKILIELDRKVKDMLGIKYKYLDEE